MRIKKPSPALLGAVPALLMLVGIGCGGDPHVEDRPVTVPVSGTVTYEGAPVEGATVTFHDLSAAQPGQPAGGQSAFGRTDSSGRYELTTFDPNDGAVPGEYAVSIRKYETVESGPVADVDDPAYEPPEPGDEPAEPESLLPEQYANPRDSELTATVSEEGDNEFPFDLTD